MSQCNKIPFKTKVDANHHIRYGIRNNNNGAKLRPYRCPDCGLWHMTSQSASDAKRVRRKMRARSR